MSSFEIPRSDCGFLHMFLESRNSWLARGSINLNLPSVLLDHVHERIFV